MGTTLLSLLMFSLKIKGMITCYTSPELTWPLGRGIINQEVVTNAAPESRGNLTFMTSPLSFEAIKFLGAPGSYVDIRLGDLSDDYTLYFHINPSVYGGCILHYMSDSQSTSGILQYRIDQESDGKLTYSVIGDGVTYVNGGATTSTFVVPTNQWTIVIVEIDISKKHAKITIDNWNTEWKGDVIDPGKNHVWPGTLRIGASQNGVGTGFNGGVVCFHKLGGKNRCEDPAFQTDCEGNWATTSSTTTSTTTTTTPTTTSTTTTTSPTTTSTTTTTTTTTTPTTTSTTTTTFAPTTTSTTLAPTTTSTTLAPTTTTTTLAPATLAPTTTSTTLAPTTTTTTLAPTTPTTTLAPTTTSTTLAPTTPTTTLAPTTTSTTLAPTTTTSTLAPTTTSTTLAPMTTATTPIGSTVHDEHQLQTGCRQYSLYNTSAVYGNTGDVIVTKIVSDIRECLLQCDVLNDCMTFSFEWISENVSARCMAGTLDPVLDYRTDCLMYEVGQEKGST